MSLGNAIKKLTVYSTQETIPELIKELRLIAQTSIVDPYIFLKLSSQLRSLLSSTDIKLGDAAAEALISLITIKQLSDSAPRGALLTSAELIRQVEKLDPKLTKLNLKGTPLAHVPIDELAKFFAILPRSLKELDLSNIGLNDLSTAELIKVLTALPPRLDLLDLSGNGLGHRHAELEVVCAKLPNIERIIFETKHPECLAENGTSSSVGFFSKTASDAADASKSASSDWVMVP